MKNLALALALALALSGASAVSAQSIAQKVKETGNGTLHLMFESKPGVCGDGRGSISIHSDGEQDWNYRRCEPGPVRVDLSVADGVVTTMRTYVGGHYPEPEFRVGTHAAVSYLLDLAQHATPSVAKKAIFPAMLADSVEPWPQIIAVAKDQNVDREVRKSAIFWLGQGAGDKATEGLKSFLSDDDVEVRKSAVFGLSQLRDNAGVDALIEIAKTNKNPEVRKSALFWLGQKNDPRVLALYEDILLKK
jgi:hypothetical protein